MRPPAPPSFPALFLADHLALDLLNTVRAVNGSLEDTLVTDADALDWLAQAGQPLPLSPFPPGSLLSALRQLREALRDALTAQQAGRPIPLGPLNTLLQQAQSCLELTPGPDGSLSAVRRAGDATPMELLSPLAESAAALLTDPHPDLIRQCEDPLCVLWFYDRTRSHHRRWCSPASCGNRNKVAAFRRRRLRPTPSPAAKIKG